MSKTIKTIVRVLGCDFELRPGTENELRGKWGRCDFQNRNLIYAEHLPDSTIRECVFHELLHLADVSISIEKTELTEEQVTGISAVLFGILNDHSQVVDWLFEDKKGKE